MMTLHDRAKNGEKQRTGAKKSLEKVKISSHRLFSKFKKTLSVEKEPVANRLLDLMNFFSKCIQTTPNQHIIVANIIPNNFKAIARLKLHFI